MDRPPGSAPLRLPLLVLLGVSGLALAPALLLDRIPAETDLVAHYGPWSSSTERETISGGDSFFVYLPDRLAAVREWKAGRLPLWNPHVGGGMPILGMQTANPLDPLITLHLGVSLGRALGLAYAALLFLAGLGMVLFLRARGLQHPAALTLAGVAFALNPYFLSWLELRVFLAGLAMLPLALWALDDLTLGARRSRCAGTLALCLGYAAVAGTLQTLALGLGILALRAGWNAFQLRRRAESASRPLLVAGSAVVLGLAVGVLPIVAGMELFGQSVRAQAHRGYYADANFLPWRAIGLWWNADLFGTLEGAKSPNWDVFRRTANSGSGWGALGILPLGLALFALVCRAGPRHERVFWGGLAGITLMGLLLLRPLGDVVGSLWPGLHAVDLLRFLVVVNLGGAVLAGWGAQALLQTWRDGRRREWLRPFLGFVLIGLVTLAAARWGLAHTLSFPRAALPLGLVCLAVLALGYLNASRGLSTPWKGWALVALVALELGWLHFSVNRFSLPDTAYPHRPILEPIRATLGPPEHSRFFVYGHMRVFPPNIGSVFEMADLRSYTNVPIARFRSLLEWAEGEEMGNQEFLTHVDSPIYRLLGARFLFAHPKMAGPAFVAAPLPQFPVGYFRRPDALARAFLVHGVERVGNDADLRTAMQSPQFDPLRAVLLVGDVGGTIEVAPAVGEEQVGIRRLDPTRHSMEVRASAPGILVVSDVYYPGWWARVNDRSAEILPAYGGLRGVWVPAGTSRVEFGYRPGWLRPGIALSVIALAVSLWLVVGAPKPESRAAQP